MAIIWKNMTNLCQRHAHYYFIADFCFFPSLSSRKEEDRRLLRRQDRKSLAFSTLYFSPNDRLIGSQIDSVLHSFLHISKFDFHATIICHSLLILNLLSSVCPIVLLLSRTSPSHKSYLYSEWLRIMCLRGLIFFVQEKATKNQKHVMLFWESKLIHKLRGKSKYEGSGWKVRIRFWCLKNEPQVGKT